LINKVQKLGNSSIVSLVAISNCCNYIATTSDDNLAIIWNMDTGSKKFTLEGHEKTVNTVSFS